MSGTDHDQRHDPRTEASRWLEQLRDSGRSANTVDAYGGDIAQYVRFLSREGITDVRDVVQADVEAFVRAFATEPSRTGRPRAESTVARVVSAVRVFHTWLRDERITVENAAAGVPPPAAVRAAPTVLDRADVAALLSSVPGDEPIDLRDRAVLSLLVLTGIQTGEVVALDVDHVLDDGRRIAVPGDRPRPLPVTDPRALRAWVERGRPRIAGDDPALFPNARGLRLTRQGVWRIVTDRAVEAGLPAGTSPRTLRNTFAALERDAGTPEDAVRELLGSAPWTGRVELG